MEKRIAILRGINVGGKRKVLMAELKKMFQNLGFENCLTYIQSGNVVFEAREEITNAQLSFQLETAIKKQFGFEVPVVVRSLTELENVVKNNPFYTASSDINQLYVTFLKELPKPENKIDPELYQKETDKFECFGSHVFLFCSGKYHETKFSNNFFEKQLKVGASTRNWKTVLKLLELSKNA